MNNTNTEQKQTLSIIGLAIEIHETAKEKGWWDKERNDGEAMALCHTEIREAYEGLSGNKMDDKIPEYPMWLAEQADTLIRLLDWAMGRGYFNPLSDEGKQLTQLTGEEGIMGFSKEYHWSMVKCHFGDLHTPSLVPALANIHGHLFAHNAIAAITEALRKPDNQINVADAIYKAILLLSYPLDRILPVVRAKMDFNKTRSHRHGGKAF